MTRAFNYETQEWVEGQAAIDLLTVQLTEEIELLKQLLELSSDNADRYCAMMNINKEQALVSAYARLNELCCK